MILSRVEKYELCELNNNQYKIIDPNIRYRMQKSTDGHYYRNDDVFFALYRTSEGPYIMFDGQSRRLLPNLTINVDKQDKKRHFSIKEYGIEIDYPTSMYIDWDAFSTEEDVDLFVLIANNYKNPEFYEVYTVKE